MPPAKENAAGDGYNGTPGGHVDHQLVKIDAAIAEERCTRLVGSWSRAFYVVGAGEADLSYHEPGGIDRYRWHG